MTKFLKWLYLTDNGLVTQSATIGSILSIMSTVYNQQFDINAAFWAILPLVASWHFAIKLQARRKQLQIKAIFA